MTTLLQLIFLGLKLDRVVDWKWAVSDSFFKKFYNSLDCFYTNLVVVFLFYHFSGCYGCGHNLDICSKRESTNTRGEKTS